MKRIVIAVSLVLACAATATAASPQDPTVGGQNNSTWGCVASNLARTDTEGFGSGGSFGLHSRSTTAANLQGGFTSDENAFGITFNVREEGETNNGRAGVGNFTTDRFGVHPGDGGQGVHAAANADTALIINPYSGELGDPEEIACER